MADENVEFDENQNNEQHSNEGEGSGTPAEPDYKAEVATLKESVIRLQGMVEGLAAAKPAAAATTPAEPARYTRSQLNAAVEAGTISQDEADNIYEDQLRTSVVKSVQQEVGAMLSKSQINTEVGTQLAEYKKLVPACMQQGSKERQELQEEYSRLRAMGHPKGDQTEMIAARIVFGPLEKLRKTKELPRKAEGAQEGSGAAAESSPEGEDKKAVDAIKTLTARERSHYSRLIDSGIYKNWDAVRAELANRRKRA